MSCLPDDALIKTELAANVIAAAPATGRRGDRGPHCRSGPATNSRRANPLALLAASRVPSNVALARYRPGAGGRNPMLACPPVACTRSRRRNW